MKKLLILVMAALIVPAGNLLTADSGGKRTEDVPERAFENRRLMMVERQLKGRDITDPAVLAACSRVARHRFVPDSFRIAAYEDYPLPIGYDQTISQPYIVALMTQLLKLDSLDRVLEIGTGSGYQAAILGELAAEVYTIEIVGPLGERATAILDTLGYENVHVKVGDGYRGWPEYAPFDAIIATCAPDKIPEPLVEQLADSGRMVIPVGTYYQELVLVTKRDGEIKRQSITPVRFVPMTGEAQKK